MRIPPQTVLLFLALPLACTEGRIDDTVVVETGLTVEEPARGAIISNSRITVRGSVTPSLVDADVTVGGRLVEVDEEGRFEIALSLPPGLNHIHTLVNSDITDEIRDTRAVLIGPFARSNESAASALRARVDSENIATMGDAVALALSETDFNTRLAEGSPEFSSGDDGCLSARGTLEELSIGSVDIDASPTDGGLHIALTLYDLEGVIDTSYRVACIRGSSTIPFTADQYYLDATVSLETIEGAFNAGVTVHDSDIDNFAITFTGNETFDELMTNVDWLISPSLGWLARKQVGPAVTYALDDLTSRDMSIDVAGQELVVASEPESVVFDEGGANIEIATRIYAPGIQGPGYPVTAIDTPNAAFPLPDEGFTLRVADEVFHQALVALWNTGLMTTTIDTQTLGTSNAGGQLTGVAIDALLPPSVVFGEENELPAVAIGDMIIELLGPDRVHARVAVSAVMNLAVEEGPLLDDGATTVRPRTSITASWIDVLAIDPASEDFLDDELVTALIEAALGQASHKLSGAFDVIALPTFARTAISEPRMVTRPGTIDIGGALRIVE